MITRRLGTVSPHTDRLMSPVQFSYSASSLPAEFQATTRWPGLVSPPGKVGRCGQGWAVSAVKVLEARTSLARGERLELESDRLGCEAGTVQQAWAHLRHVSQSVSSEEDYHFPLRRVLTS